MTNTSSTIGRLWARARRYAGADRGNVTITFALALVPLMVAAGGAVDYTRSATIKTKLNAAADSAALAAVDKSAANLDTAAAQALALSLFNANIAALRDATVTTTTADITDSGGGRTAVVRYTATVNASFLGLIGKRTIDVSGSATAATGMPTYIDFYLLLDNTPSMGIGATTADINTMVTNTSDRCAFACHDTSASPNDYYSLAKSLGVQMRIDVMRQATQQLMDTATSMEQVQKQFRMAIYTFGSSARNPGLTAVQSLTSNLSKAKKSAGDIDLMTVPYQNYADDTDTDFSLFDDLNTKIAAPGDGSSHSSPQKFVFFVSDGVGDRALGSPACSQRTTTGNDPQTGKSYLRCQEPLDPAYCKTLKDRGVKVAVLYTTYLPLPTNSWYTSWIAPFAGTIATNMQTCASPGLYFEVSPSQGISEAMTALFQKAVQQARLTR